MLGVKILTGALVERHPWPVNYQAQRFYLMFESLRKMHEHLGGDIKLTFYHLRVIVQSIYDKPFVKMITPISDVLTNMFPFHQFVLYISFRLNIQSY